MAIDATDWYEDFFIFWKDDQIPRGLVGFDRPGVYRMKVTSGGALILQEKVGGGFRIISPDAWTHLKVPDDPTI
ncbi:hypothetical protein [Mycobacterium sp. M26]|uniref:hypothetical protein n=1 Tax=Mycobacterium sp. M26 TaxID=1762962 RepID=UPI00073F1941|nr:hypothetical protein [Mycobacterium sp. M26]